MLRGSRYEVIIAMTHTGRGEPYENFAGARVGQINIAYLKRLVRLKQEGG
jgi:hypothetical protein